MGTSLAAAECDHLSGWKLAPSLGRAQARTALERYDRIEPEHGEGLIVAMRRNGADDLVFAHPHTGQVLDHSDLARRYKKALRAAHLRDVRFNDLRHTFGTRMAAASVPLRTVQEWMGHRDFKTTLIYADYCPSEHESEMVERAFARDAAPGAGETAHDRIPA